MAVTVAPASAWAFGGTAADLAKQGNFVISNRANLGFTTGLSYAGTTLDLAPELDVMVVQGLSLGGAALFHWDSGPGYSHTNAGIVPQIGYDVTLSGSCSFWPRAAVGIIFTNPSAAWLELSAPFLLHPANHFFFGFGPGVQVGLGGNPLPPNTLFGTFLIGGYFDS
jgi:hypothetical protein